MNSPADSPNAIRSRLPNGGDCFLVRDAASAMEDFYRTERLDGYDDGTVVVLAGKYGQRSSRCFEIGFFHSFSLMTQLGVSFRFPVSLRCLLLRPFMDRCDSLADADRLFSNIRSSRWFRRYASLPAAECSVRWTGENEMADMLGEMPPRMTKAMGPHL